VREQEVLALMVRGAPNKVMAGDLGVSQRTVEVHRAHVMDKMEARSIAQLVRMVVDAGLVKEPSSS
jgi:two-component system response regulator FixJ